MYTEIDLEAWPRKSSYDFFKTFEDPFFNLTAQVDVTGLYHRCMENNISFFLASLHTSQQATSKIEAFRMRILDKKVVCFDTIHLGSTVLFEDNTFGFCYFRFDPNQEIFLTESARTIAEFKQQKSFDPKLNQIDMIHYSVIPWVAFTSFKHARQKRIGDCIPKIVFGKRFQQGDRHLMPVSVEVNHALMDGYHVGQYFEKFEKLAR